MKKILKRTTLALSVLLGTWLSSSAYACDTHDHLCTYHALGVPRPTYNVNNDETRLVIYAKATDTSHGNAQTDFDNHVLLPTSSTSHDWLGLSAPDTRPFINSRTSYGQANPSDVGEWETSDTKGAHVYGSQYQVIFNKNTAQAIHTGDLNGGEKGRTPYQQGCPAYEGKPNCEAVVITGNVPSGTYQQQVQMFNFFNKDNPSAVLTVGAWATGQGVLVSDTHLDSNTQSMIANNGRLNDSISQGTTEQTHYAFLEGSKSKLAQPINYKFYNRGFDPHASGTVSWDHSRFHHLGYTKPYNITTEKHIHTYRNSLYRLDTNTTTIGADGSRNDVLTYGKTRVGQAQHLGSVVNPAYLEAIRQKQQTEDVLVFKNMLGQALGLPSYLADKTVKSIYNAGANLINMAIPKYTADGYNSDGEYIGKQYFYTQEARNAHQAEMDAKPYTYRIIDAETGRVAVSDNVNQQSIVMYVADNYKIDGRNIELNGVKFFSTEHEKNQFETEMKVNIAEAKNKPWTLSESMDATTARIDRDLAESRQNCSWNNKFSCAATAWFGFEKTFDTFGNFMVGGMVRSGEQCVTNWDGSCIEAAVEVATSNPAGKAVNKTLNLFKGADDVVDSTKIVDKSADVTKKTPESLNVDDNKVLTEDRGASFINLPSRGFGSNVVSSIKEGEVKLKYIIGNIKYGIREKIDDIIPNIVMMERGKNSKSTDLTKNLEQAGVQKPAGTQAHHIVGQVTDKGREAVSILNKFGIDINSAYNGVFLPGCNESNAIGMVHCGKHTETYEEAVLDRLKKAKSSDEAKKILSEIRNELLNDSFVDLNKRSAEQRNSSTENNTNGSTKNTQSTPKPCIPKRGRGC